VSPLLEEFVLVRGLVSLNEILELREVAQQELGSVSLAHFLSVFKYLMDLNLVKIWTEKDFTTAQFDVDSTTDFDNEQTTSKTR
jgi:hypothetical protein